MPHAAPLLEDEILRSLPDALEGDEAAARRYARAWDALVERLAADPGSPAADVLRHLALTAPFHPSGPLAAAVSVARSTMGSVPALPKTDPLPVPDALTYQRFSRIVLSELSGAGTGLDRLLASWQLSITEAAGLFGVSRQALQQWLDEGVPPARQPRMLLISRVADLLERNLRPERIPAVVRAPAPAFRGRSILDLIREGREAVAMEAVEASFDWAATA